MNICIVVHTHSDYSDIWHIVFDRLNKYGPKYDLYTLSNKEIPHIKSTILYDDNLVFSKRILLLKQLPYKYILFMRDSDILVGPTYIEKLHMLEEAIHKYNIDSLRLNNSGIEDIDLINHIENDVYSININCPYLFSLYPTIWKKEALIEIMDNFSNYKYYDLECEAVNQYCKKFINCFVYNKNTKLRQYNERYAHVVKFIHILQHGKWTYVHDPEYVLEIQKEFHIDLTKRGFHNSAYRRPSQTNSWHPT